MPNNIRSITTTIMSTNLPYLRKFLIKFSSTLVGLFTVFSMIALFSIWSLNRAYQHSQEDSQRIRDLADEALVSQINFKIQVQEWKNILLRGDIQSTRNQYYEAFILRSQDVENHLMSIIDKTAALGLNELQSEAQDLLDEHKRIFLEYQSSLKSIPNLSFETARKIDKKLIGIDRDLEARLTVLSQKILDLNISRREQYNTVFHEHYLTLRMLLLISILISIVMTSLNIYSALRVIRE